MLLTAYLRVNGKPARKETIYEVFLPLPRDIGRDALYGAVICFDEKDMRLEDTFLHPLLYW